MSGLDDRIVDPAQELEPEAHERVEVLEREARDEDVAAAAFDEVRPEAAARHFQEVSWFVAAVLRGDDVEAEREASLLSEVEREAITVFEMVVRGKDERAQQIVYAETRLEMLNHVLAVLQPTLAAALMPELVELRDQYDEIVEQVEALRERLEQLDGAQEEVFAHEQEVVAEGEADEDDGGEGDGEGEGEGAEQVEAEAEAEVGAEDAE